MIRKSERALLGLLLLLSGGLGAEGADSVQADSIERGRYLVRIAGCNDCHTPGYLLSEGNVPESRWLTGDSFGWRGPWGTTYPSNLRMLIQTLSEAQWLVVAKNLQTRPPMPWFNLNLMQDDDLRAIYRFVRSLGPGGKPAPPYVPPDREPPPPYASFPSPPPLSSE